MSVEEATIRVVTRGDDAGNARSANRGMIEAVETGVLRNISLMAPCAEIEDAAHVLLDLQGVDFGFHVTLTSEFDFPRWGPVAGAERVPGLVLPDGTFPHTGQDVDQRPFEPEQVQIELEAQFERLTALGFRPAYMDEHMGIGWTHEGRTATLLAEFAREKGLIFRPALDEWPAIPAADDKVVSAPGRFRALLQVAEPGHTYLSIGHPAYDDEEMRQFRRETDFIGAIAKSRDQQRQQFTAPEVLAIFEQRGIRPIRYSEI